MNKVVLEKLKRLLKTEMGRSFENIDEDMKIRSDLRLSSMDLAELVCLVEDEFDTEIPDRAIRGFQTVGDLVSFIEKR